MNVDIMHRFGRLDILSKSESYTIDVSGVEDTASLERTFEKCGFSVQREEYEVWKDLEVWTVSKTDGSF